MPDIADIIYAKHRCSHAHGQALPREYEFIDDGRFPCMYIGKDQVKLSRQVILGLLLIVILSPVNAESVNPKLDGLGISLGVDGEKRELIINDWWGQAERFRAEILPLFPAPKLVLDCSKIENQSEYRLSDASIIQNWDFKTPKPVANIQEALMANNRQLHVLYCAGYYDALTPVGYLRYLLSHFSFPKEQVMVRYYESGHMPYLGSESAHQLGKDMRAFLTRK